MKLGLAGKVAVVTGASRGLGKACALALAGEGVHIAACARNGGRLTSLSSEIKALGVRCHTEELDLGQTGRIPAFIEGAALALGSVDILVTNAGGPQSGPFESISEDTWVGAVSQNLMSVVALCRASVKIMKAKRWGRIINITSVSAKQPLDRLVVSNSLRAGVSGLAKTLANEMGPFGITVNNVAPGFTETERLHELASAAAKQEGLVEEVVLQRWRAGIPAGRLGVPDDIAQVAVFLASEAASYVNGQTIAVDGGWSRSVF